MFLYFYYYFTQYFVNAPAKKAYFAFLIIYVTGTFIARPLQIGFYTNYKQINRSICHRFWGDCLLMFLSLIHAEYLWVILCYRTMSMTFSYRHWLKITVVFTRIGQIFVQITFITIQGINYENNLIKSLTIGLSSFQIIFNIIVALAYLV